MGMCMGIQRCVPLKGPPPHTHTPTPTPDAPSPPLNLKPPKRKRNKTALALVKMVEDRATPVPYAYMRSVILAIRCVLLFW